MITAIFWESEFLGSLRYLPGVFGVELSESLGILIAEGFMILGDGVLSAETLMVAGLLRGELQLEKAGVLLLRLTKRQKRSMES